MKNIVNKILILIAILGIVISQSIVFANNVGLDPNGHIEMPMSIKTNRAETIGIKNLQNYQLSYQLVETPSENYKKYIAFIDESNARKEQLTNEKNQLKTVVEAAQAEAEAKYKIYSELNSNIHSTNEQREQARLAFEAAKDVADKALQPYQAKLNEMEAYDKLTEETLKNYIPLYDDTKWQTSDGTFTIPSNNDGKERIVTVWVRVVDENANIYYEATMYPFNLGKAEKPLKRYTLEIEEGKEYNLIIENYNPIDFKWTIDQPDIIEIVNGKIIGKKEGIATLDGISNDGRTKVSVLVTVKPRTQNNNNQNNNNQNNNNQNDNNQNDNNQNDNNQNDNNQNNNNQNNNNQNNKNQNDNNQNNKNQNNNNQNDNNQNNNNQNNNNQNDNNQNNNNQNDNNQNNNNQNNNNQNDNNSNNNQPTKPNPIETDRNISNNNNTNNTNNNNQNIINRNNKNNTRNHNSNSTPNTREINSGLEKNTPKSPERLPQTGDIPMSAVIAIITAGVIAIAMFVKIYQLRKNS